MKHLNFLSKSSSRSMGHRVTTLALTVGSPSVHRRVTMLRLLSVLVLILTIGVGNVWGAENDKAYTLDFTAKTANHSSYTDTWTYGDFSIYAGSNNNYQNDWLWVRFGGKGGSSNSSTSTINSTIKSTKSITNKVIKKVTVYYTQVTNNNYTANKCTLEVASNSDFSTIVDTRIIDSPVKSSETSFDFTPNSVSVWPASAFYRITIGATIKGKSNMGVDISKIEFIEGASAAPATVAVTGVSLNKSSTSIAEKASETLTATITPTNASNKNITWSTSNSGVATVTNGTVTAVAPGNAIITATTQDGGFTATCNVTVTAVRYSVTLQDDTENPLVQTSYGGSITLPSRAGCTGYTFAGWTKSWTSAQSSWITTAPDIIDAGSYTPQADENLYPVYTKTEGASGTKSATLYYEPFGGSANSTAVQSTNVAATTDMFTDPNATVWSHYTFNAASTTSYATNLDGDKMSNGTKILKQTNNTTVTMMEVTGIKITNATNLSLSLYNRRTYTSASLKISYKIDNGSYTAVGGTIAYNNTNDNWKLSDGLTISGTGNSLALKIELVVSGTTNRTMLLDDIKVTGQIPNATTYYISDPNCCTSLGSIKGSFFWTTHFCPVWPAKH